MKVDLLHDYPLRGSTLENTARILLRREKGHNFIFCCRHFDSVDEIILKYRLDCSDCVLIVNDLRCNGLHSDLIEFYIEDNIDRKVLQINFYDVKSRMIQSPFKYFEMCVSDYEFMKHIQELNCGAHIISILLFENWRFDFEIYKFNNSRIRVYDSSLKKTVFFT
jgi:hypothetical protein